MPCYNKVEYISDMLNSVLAQEWNNIELILVNDGSTDGTRDIISEYEPKFIERGYEVVIIDQDNAGVCAAAKAGLESATGEYISCIDADDELDSKYVSIMAEWLEANADYDICMCSYYLYEIKDGTKKKIQEYSTIADGIPINIDAWLLCRMTWVPWVYLVRKRYFDKCKIAENYYVYSRGSHEPFLAVPLLAYGGKIKCFEELLYHFNSTEDENRHSLNLSIEKAKKHWNEYWRNARIAIKQLDAKVFDDKTKQRMLALMALGMHRTTFLDFRVGSSEIVANQMLGALGIVDRYFTIHQIPYGICEFLNFWQADELLQRYMPLDCWYVYDRISQFLLSKDLPPRINSFRRIIGYGSRGDIAKKVLPILKWSPMQPTELWDIADNNCDFDSLSEKDCVIVLPIKREVCEEIMPILDSAGCYVVCLRDLHKNYIAECIRHSLLVDME